MDLGSEKVTLIYVLIDPNTYLVRYVGKTEQTLKARFDRHLSDARNAKPPKNHRECWIGSLLNKNQEPIMYVIEECKNSEWEIREKHWIKVWKENGADLTNGTKGGGFSGEFTPETCSKISKSLIGRKQSPEHITKNSAGHKGLKHSEESKKKMREAQKGKKKSLEHARNISKGKKGFTKFSEETKKKMSESKSGEKNPNFGKPRDRSIVEKAAKSCGKDYEIVFPDGHRENIKGLNRFCKENSLCASSIIRQSKKGKTHKGYYIVYTELAEDGGANEDE